MAQQDPAKHLVVELGLVENPAQHLVVELVPVVVHFPKLMWLLAFSVTLAPVRVKRKWTRSGSFSAMFACSP